jgi:hypothetical protein
MIELELTRAAEAFGRDVKRQQDEAGTSDGFQAPGLDKRWTGFAVEHVIDAYLTSRGIDHVWNGGMDRKPDFEVGPLGIASKANAGPGEPGQDYAFVIPKDQIGRLAHVALFSVFNVRDRKVWIAGAVHASTFRGSAELKRKGEEGFVPGRPLVADCWMIRQGALLDAEWFLKMLEVSVAA